MEHPNTREYYLAREQQERVIADAATDSSIAGIHRDMAERYAALAGQSASLGRKLALVDSA